MPRRMAARLSGEDGFTLVTVMGVIMIVMLLSAAAFASVNGDQRPGLADKDRKTAYAAAEAGVNDYLANLTANPEFWRRCDAQDADKGPTHDGLNLASPGAARRWRAVQGTTAQYSIEVLPANGAAQCDTNDPIATFIDKDTGTFRVRSTGRARARSTKTRSLIATFRRRGFLDYIYFTEYETGDPAMFRLQNGGRETRWDEGTNADPNTLTKTMVDWGNAKCKNWVRETPGNGTAEGKPSRLTQRFTGWFKKTDGSWERITTSDNVRCTEIRFVGTAAGKDLVAGPFHTNDEVLVCGTPRFGRSPSDQIEISGPPADAADTLWGFRQDSGCSGRPEANFPDVSTVETDRGTWRKQSPLVNLPSTNATLKDDALPAYRFMGKTTIELNGDTMTVTGKRVNGTPAPTSPIPVPKQGVIYVNHDTAAGACAPYDPQNPENYSNACGNVIVKGTYARSLTILAENDVIVNGDLKASGTAKPLLGLIANSFVRVDSPVNSSCTNTGGPKPSITIEAAILALWHSFTVDRYWCGGELGNLNVHGAIGQMFRGPVGQSNGSSRDGYIKNYTYNDELRFRSPPRFLDPVQTTWKLKSQVEQSPAETVSALP